MEDRVITISVFSDPANPGGSQFRWVVEPMAGIMMQPEGSSAALSFREGTSFRFRYLVTLHARPLTAEAVSSRFERWQTEVGARATGSE
jgi:hypothetical protein